MQLLLVTLLVAGALCAPTPQLSDISTQDGNTRLVPLFVRDPEGSPNTPIPVVVPAPAGAQDEIEGTAQVVDELASQVASVSSDIDHVAQTEKKVEATIEEEISEAAAVEDAINAAVEEVQSSGAQEAVVQAELVEAEEAQATVDGTVASDVQLAAEAEEAALVEVAEDITDIVAPAGAEIAINEEADLSDGGSHTSLPDAMSNVMAMVVQAAVEKAEEENVAASEVQKDSVVVGQATETAVLETEQVDSTGISEAEVAEPEVVQEVILAESGAEGSELDPNVDTSENSGAQTEVVSEVLAVEEEPSQVQEAIPFEAGATVNAEESEPTDAQVIEVAEESPAEEVLSITPAEELQISTIDDTIAEAEAVVAKAEEILSGVIDTTAPQKISEKVQEEVVPEARGKSLSSAAETTAADTGAETAVEVTAVEGAVTIDEATRSAIEAALSSSAPDAAAIVIFPQATAEGNTQTDEGLLLDEGITSQTEQPVLTEVDAFEQENAPEAVVTIPVEVTTDVITVIDEAPATPTATDVQIPESSASQTAEVVSSQVAVETKQQLPKQRPTPAQGNLLVNPATKSAFFSTSSFGSPISAANIILGQPVRVPRKFGAISGLTPQLQGSSNIQARNLVDPQFRQFIFDNDSPDVVAAKINFFRVRAATLGAPLAISVGSSSGSSSTVAPDSVDALESVQSAGPEVAIETSTSAAQEAAPSIAVEAVESSTAVPSEAA